MRPAAKLKLDVPKLAVLTTADTHDESPEGRSTSGTVPMKHPGLNSRSGCDGGQDPRACDVIRRADGIYIKSEITTGSHSLSYLITAAVRIVWTPAL
jgi:hypothetical protein